MFPFGMLKVAWWRSADGLSIPKTTPSTSLPEHPLFFKGKLLYGFDVAAKPIENENLAIVCEGYTDALACHRFGFHHAVATLGTAMTSDHARLLERRTSRVLLLFDGDAAGVRAARRAVEITFKQNLDVTICVLPDGQDPDDVLSEGGPEAFQAQLDRAVDALEWLLSEFAKDTGAMEMPTDSGGPSVSCWSWPTLASTACPPCARLCASPHRIHLGNRTRHREIHDARGPGRGGG